jgi:hypothetical protein
MEVQTVESVVRRLFSDAEFRARATANASEAFAEYELDADQLVALGNLCERLGSGDGAGAVPAKFWF